MDRWQALDPEQHRQLRAPLPRHLVVELARPCEEGPRGLSTLRQKMAAYQANCAWLGCLMLLQAQAVKEWPAIGSPQRLE